MKNDISDTKILFVVSQLKVGGAAKMIKYVANLCVAHFGKVTLLTYYDDYTPDDLNTSIERVNLNVKAGRLPIWRLAALKKLRNVVKKGQYDIVCSFLPDISAMSRIATLGINTVVVSAERGDPYQFSKLWKALAGWAYKSSDYCIFQLEQARDFFDKKVAEHSFVIPNPYVPVQNVEPFEGERKKTIVSAGRFAPQKRFDVLIEAFAMVHQKHPEYKLVLYGEGDCLQEYKNLEKQLNVEGLIEYPGYVKNVTASIREDGIFVLSSDYEGIPNSLIEAMSVGLPVVATDCTPGGAAFLTNDGEKGLLIPTHDVDAMGEAINRLIDNPELSKSLSEKAKGIVKELDINVINKMWIEAFSKMLEKEI